MKTASAPNGLSGRRVTTIKPSPSSHKSGRQQVSVRPRRILLPVDFSTSSVKAVQYAAGLAQQYRAALILLHVVEPVHYVCDYGYGPVSRERPNEAMMKTVKAHLRRLGRQHFAAGTSWESLVRSGTAFAEIVKAAKELAMELIVMPTRGVTDSKEEALGSTAERVVRYAPCPVLILRKPLI